MNWLDIIIIVAIAISTFMGFRAGLIKGVLLLAGLIVAVVLAGRYYVPFSEQLTFISEANIAKVVAFTIILIVVMVIAAVLARFLKWAVSVIMLGWVNRLGGAIFGFLFGAIFCSALLAICVKFLDLAGVITESGLANILLDQLPMVLALLPDEFDAIPSFFY